MKQTDTNTSACCFADTRFGSFAVIWSDCEGRPKVRRILLSGPQLSARVSCRRYFPHAVVSSVPEISLLINKIESFLNGADVYFSLDIVCLDICSAFQKQVLLAEYAIPRGKVSTYNMIAGYLQNPRGARAVGTALATNPFPVVIPCHRAIRSDGTLGGYQGGLKMKRDLLEMEGIVFDDSGRVTVDGFFYQKQIFRKGAENGGLE